jgi:hypothetical protein
MPRRSVLALALALSACAPADDSAGATSSAPAAVLVEVLTHDEVFSTDAGGAIVRGDLISVHACADGICQPVPWSTTGTVARPEIAGDTYRFAWAIAPE